MSELLLISDDLSRAERLAQDLAKAGRVLVHDLYNDASLSAGPRLIIADVARMTSEAVVRLRSVLKQIRGAGVRLIFLTHGNPARTEIHARVLGADEIIPAAAATGIVCDRMAQLSGDNVAAPAAAIKLAAEARQFFVHAFFSGRQVTPELAATGSDLIARAIKESGIRDWVGAVRRFDDVTHQHCLMVAGLAAAFATSLGLGKTQSFRLTKAALLHDVGKTRIPLAILNKPAALTAEEMKIMRTHATIGYDLLVSSDFPQETLTVARSHHELLDGSGYPDQLSGDQIPDLVRLVTICDIYGALIERRVYKPPMPGEKAYAILEGMIGRLDPHLVRAFRPVATAFDPFARAGSAAIREVTPHP